MRVPNRMALSNGSVYGRKPALPATRHACWIGPGLIGRLARTVHAISSAIASGSSCSQTRTGVHPSLIRAWLSARSRASLRLNFACQNSVLVLGVVAWTGQRCQKHPSTKTATRDGPNTMSGRTQRPAASTRLSFLKRRPRACSAERRRRSGCVSARRLARIVRRASWDIKPEPAVILCRVSGAGKGQVTNPWLVRFATLCLGGWNKRFSTLAGGRVRYGALT